ncbi:MAG: ATP-dependent Clp protease ATP-binding subunit [Candidatus Moranbacteria bacterium]|nr:ATP-dependent Clp protease ATP-binding subunit [Candidatus Moranbacteria bacterium]
MTLHAKKSLRESEAIALFYKSLEILPEHLLLSIFLEKGSLGSKILENMGINRIDFNTIFSKKNYQEKPSPTNEKKDLIKPHFSASLSNIITQSYSIASKMGYPYIGTEHLVYALIEMPTENILKLLSKKNTKKQGRTSDPGSFFEKTDLKNLSKLFNLPDLSLTGHSSSESETPSLDIFCIDINNESATNKEKIIGREKEIERIINILGRKNKSNPLLIGDPGVGKTAIVSGLAQKINSGQISSQLAGKRILSLDLALVVAGTNFRGEFESRIKDIIQEAEDNADVILFIDEIHSIVGAGNASGGLDAANILKPALARGKIQCIGATTIEEYKRHIEKDPALERRFQSILVNEPNIENTKKILRGIKSSYEKFHNAKISDEAIEQIVNLSHRYIPERFFPDKAIDVLDETASRLRNQSTGKSFLPEIKKIEKQLHELSLKKNKLVSNEKYEEAVFLRKEENLLTIKLEKLKKRQTKLENENPILISDLDISQTISQITGISLEKLLSSLSPKIKNLRQKLNSSIIGQKEAIEKITDIIYRSYSGINDPNRPLGSFLFLGPTGAGKTLVAKELAKNLFDSEQSLIRIDMSEFMERHQASQLLGAPAGYVGFGEGGKLTEKVRRHPHSLILFDEIEKAHPDIFNILLQILEDGTLTDSEGRSINFKNTIIILTSNTGTAEFTNTSNLGFDRKNQGMKEKWEGLKENSLKELRRQMKPELLNRLDNIITFNALGKNEIKKIVCLELGVLKKRLQTKNISLSYTPEVLKLLSQKSVAFDQGARFVRKNIQKFVETEIAKAILDEKVKDKKIQLKVVDEKIIAI